MSLLDRLPALRGLGPWVAEVDARTLRADALAGLLGAVLVLPQAIAFAALAGLPPAMGLAAAALPCAVAALAGSSRQVVTGPNNATALALGAMLATLAGGAALAAPGVPAALLLPVLAIALTLMVGLMQVALAAARLGTLANFISPSVMLGFTSGAALLIGWHALGGLLGAPGRSAPMQALQAWHLAPQWPALAVGLLTLVVAAAGRRWWRRGPHMLLALLAGTALTWVLGQQGQGGPMAWWPGAAAVPRLGLLAGIDGAPAAWASLQQLPALLPPLLSQLLPMALALTIVALGQAVAIAKLLAARTGAPLDLNRECLGQGLGNLSAGLLGGMVVSGSLNRSLPNLEAGARTPLAGVAAALWLLALVALAGPLLAWLPMAGVSALLLVVAWSLLDCAAWQRLRALDQREFGIAAATALATLLLRLEVAVLAGVLLSLMAWLQRTARPAMRRMGFDQQGAGRPFVVLGPVAGSEAPADEPPPSTQLPECPQLTLLRMEGSVWFGAVPHVAEQLRALRQRQPEPARHLLVMAKSMNVIDLAGADLWDDELKRRRAQGGDLYFHRPRPSVLAFWQDTGFAQRLGADHVFPDKRRAIATIVPRLDPAVCARCQVRLFEECSQRPGAALSHEI